MLPIVNEATAMKALTRHQFIPGIGYLAHASEPDIPPGATGGKNCAPPAGTKDGSFHVMQPSHGAPQIEMRWVAAEQAWAPKVPGKGYRLAFTATHLSRAGWSYVGPSDQDGSKRRKR